jgi:hypothetical protein
MSSSVKRTGKKQTNVLTLIYYCTCRGLAIPGKPVVPVLKKLGTTPWRLTGKGPIIEFLYMKLKRLVTNN